jgi:hypothetical protein
MKEVVQKDSEGLNQLIIHDDVPFFWDNWDVCHHAFETKIKKINQNLVSFSIEENSE